MDSRWPWVLQQLKLRCLFFPCPLTFFPGLLWSFPSSVLVSPGQFHPVSLDPLVVVISLPAFFFSVCYGPIPSHYFISRPGEQTFYKPS